MTTMPPPRSELASGLSKNSLKKLEVWGLITRGPGDRQTWVFPGNGSLAAIWTCFVERGARLSGVELGSTRYFAGYRQLRRLTGATGEDHPLPVLQALSDEFGNELSRTLVAKRLGREHLDPAISELIDMGHSFHRSATWGAKGSTDLSVLIPEIVREEVLEALNIGCPLGSTSVFERHLGALKDLKQRPAQNLGALALANARHRGRCGGSQRCQSAFNRDPLSARKRDPLAEMLGG